MTAPLSTYFADFHVHIGRSQGRPVKIAAAASLTLPALIDHARQQKGLDIVTVIDGVCTGVLEDIRQLLDDGDLRELDGGGLLHANGLVLFLGAEVETAGPTGGAAHFGCWFGRLSDAAAFSTWLATVQKNPSLSSQRARCTAFDLQQATVNHGGMFVVHHAFTPHKGLYGACVTHLSEMVDPDLVDGLELGLSSDSEMADGLSELSNTTFLSNSDAHSLAKIAREYNTLRLATPSFGEVRQALHRLHGRCVTANYGLEPKLGKYHRTRCANCGLPWSDKANTCACGSQRQIKGVADRFMEIRDGEGYNAPPHRPPYIHQIPLEFVPGLGPKARLKLLDTFGSEMQVLHHAGVDELAAVVGRVLAERIEMARSGRASIVSGGGGIYGRVEFNP